MNSTFFHIWKFPMLLGVLTMFGLLAALTGTGVWHVLSWLALIVPIVVCVRFGVFQKNQKAQ